VKVTRAFEAASLFAYYSYFDFFDTNFYLHYFGGFFLNQAFFNAASQFGLYC